LVDLALVQTLPYRSSIVLPTMGTILFLFGLSSVGFPHQHFQSDYLSFHIPLSLFLAPLLFQPAV
jgi:hypothetical protein